MENNRLNSLKQIKGQLASFVKWRNDNGEITSQKENVTYMDYVLLLHAADIIQEKGELDQLTIMGLYQPRGYELFYNYLREMVLPELLSPTFFKRTSYVGSSSVDVQRLYSLNSEDGSFSRLLVDYSQIKRNYVGKYVPDTFLNKWIDKFELGHHVTLSNSEGGFGIVAMIHKSEEDKGRLLADEGYGITQLVSLLISIEKAILTRESYKAWDEDYYVPNVCRPTDKNKTFYREQTITIEEPENHLHPRLQSMLAEMLLDAYQNYNIHFIVETHSEYLIRKSQVLVKNMHFSSYQEADEKCPFRTYYVPKEGKPYSLGYRADGKFAEDFGKGFFDVTSNLLFDIL